MTEEEILNRLQKAREEIRDELEGKITLLFEKEKQQLMDRAQFMMNILKISGTALAVILGILGFTSFREIKVSVKDYFKTRIEDVYKLADANSPLRLEANNLLNRALINTLYTEMQSQKSKRSLHENEYDEELKSGLSSAEIERIIDVLRLQQTPSTLFQDAVKVLDELVLSEDQRKSVGDALSSLLASKPDGAFAWMSKEENKRLSIISAFLDQDVLTASSAELLTQPVADQLKFSILGRMRSGDGAGSKEDAILALISNTENFMLKSNAYLALARIKPYHDSLKSYVKNHLLKQDGRNNTIQCLLMAVELQNFSRRTSRWLEDDETSKRAYKVLHELAVPLAMKAINSGIAFHYSKKSSKNRLLVRANSESFYNMPVPISTDILSDSLVLGVLESATKKSLPDLAKCVKAFSIISVYRNEVKKYFTITAHLEKDSKLVFSDNSSLEAEDAEENTIELETKTSYEKETKTSYEKSPMKFVQMLRTKREPVAIALFANWTSDKGIKNSKAVKTMEGVEFGVGFDLENDGGDEDFDDDF
jgi:sulfur relay (sulfurtransferase) DsrF/TusC family protein